MAGAMMTLDGIAQGQDAIIASVDCVEPSLRKHILDMGLTPGTEVTFVKCAPMGDPMEVRLRGYELTLRKEDAAHIKVASIPLSAIPCIPARASRNRSAPAPASVPKRPMRR